MKQAGKKRRGGSSSVAAKLPQNGEEYGRSLHGGLAWSDCLRIAGRNRPVATMIAAWKPEKPKPHPDTAAILDALPTVTPPQLSVSPNLDDYAQIDLQLAIQVTPLLSEEPTLGAGYSAFTLAQRYHFLQWLENVDLAAPMAFQHLYLAQLESALFDEAGYQQAAQQELCRLTTLPSWQDEELLWRIMLLAFHLNQDGPGLVTWLTTVAAIPPQLIGLAMGQMAILGQPLTVPILSLLLRKWQLVGQVPDRAILQLRLAYLTTSLGADPLQYLLFESSDLARTPKPWRTAHRNLRIRIVQPDLRQRLTPHLREIAMLVQSAPPATEEMPTPPPATLMGEDETAVASSSEKIAESSNRGRQTQTKESKHPWQLVLEFGDSRSEYFIYALNQAKRRPGYLQIMDENRRMIHRVHFAKSEMRYFWSLWEYVQSWSSTQLYLNGNEIQKWKVYPYSPYLR